MANSSTDHFWNEINLPFPARVYSGYYLSAVPMCADMSPNTSYSTFILKICIILMRRFYIVFGHVFYLRWTFLLYCYFYRYLVIVFLLSCMSYLYFIWRWLSLCMYSSGVDEIKNVNQSIINIQEICFVTNVQYLYHMICHSRARISNTYQISEKHCVTCGVLIRSGS